jgi:hypothetical protein
MPARDNKDRMAPFQWAVAAGTEHEPTADPALPSVQAYELDQRIVW